MDAKKVVDTTKKYAKELKNRTENTAKSAYRFAKVQETFGEDTVEAFLVTGNLNEAGVENKVEEVMGLSM